MNDEQKKLVEDNQKLVYFVINRYFPTYILNEDVAQEGMLGLCKAANKYDPSTGGFSTFATHCIFNTITMFLKRENKHNKTLSLDYPVVGEADDILSFGDCIIGEEDIDYFDDSYWKSQLEQMKPREREVFKLLEQGYSTVEIAKKLGTVKANVCRIRRKYENKWEKDNGND